jgi:hypothetical protein
MRSADLLLASLGPDTGLAGAAMGWLHRYAFGSGREPAGHYAELFRFGGMPNLGRAAISLTPFLLHLRNKLFRILRFQ